MGGFLGLWRGCGFGVCGLCRSWFWLVKRCGWGVGGGGWIGKFLWEYGRCWLGWSLRWGLRSRLLGGMEERVLMVGRWRC